ncbi:MAG: FtsX-like permease family protein, partial [Candidatus Thorarchaeota archaeon]
LISNASLDSQALRSKVQSISELYKAGNSFRICDDNLSRIAPGSVSIAEYSDAMEYIEQFFDPGSVIRENILDNQSAVFVSFTDTPSDFSNISIGHDYSLCLPDFDFPNQNVLMTNVTITGRALIPWDSFWKQETVLSNRYFYGDLDEYFLSGEHLIVRNLTTFLLSIPPEHWATSYGLWYDFDLKAFDSFDPDEILEAFDSLAVDAQRNLAESKQFDHFEVEDGISFQIERVRDEINTIRIGLLLFSIPVLIVAIFLANYSFGLIQRAKFQHIGIYLTRGTSRSQLTLILVVETLLSLFISLIGGILLGIPLAALVVKTSGFLEFNKPKNPVILWMDLIESVAAFGVVLVTILNFVRIFRMGKLTISDAEIQAVEEKTEPFWRRKYLDIGFLAFGMFFYGLFILLMSERIGVDPGIAFLLALLVLPTPLLIIVGAIMVTARIFPFITDFISKLQWERQGGLFSFSLKNIVRHRQNSTRAILIASMNLAMIVLFLSFPSTIEGNIKTQAYYDTGADIRVGLSDPSFYNNITILDHIMTNISSEIEEYSPGLIARLKNNQIMVINTTTFAKTAWMEDYFVPDLSSALKNLNKDNVSILLYEENLKAIKGKVGDSLLWPKRTWDPYEPAYVGVPIHFTVRGTFRYWPNLLTDNYEVEEYPRTQFLAVANFETYENVVQIMKNETANEEEYIEGWATGLRIDDSFLYLRIKNNANLRHIEETLETLVEETTVISSYSIAQEEYEARMRNPTTLSLFAQFNSNLIFCLGIAVLVLATFGFLQLLERGREIATERALGLSVSQTVRLFLYDTLWLLGFSLLAGLLIGTFFASLFMLPLTLGQTFPPWSMIFPWDLIVSVMVLILIGSVGFSLIPAYLSSKIEVTRLLRVE